MTAVGGLAARLARLEQIVSGLQGQAGGGEQLSPNYLTVDPSGLVGAHFTGLVNALGLIIPESGGAAIQLTNSVQWQDPTGVATEIIEGQVNSGGPPGSFWRQLALQTRLSPTLPHDFAELDVIAAGGHGGSSVQANLEDGTGGSQGPVFMDSAGNSSFVQLGPLPGQLFIDGPHSVGIPALAPGAFTTVSFATTRTAWTSAVPLGMVAGAELTASYSYPGGANWNFTFQNPQAAAQAASQWWGFVIGH